MESVLGRYRNLIILFCVLSVQAVGLAVQVKRVQNDQSTRLIRIWAVGAVTPFEKAIVWAQTGVHTLWHDYFFLRGVRQENRDLKAQLEQLRLQQVRLNEDAAQAHRLQALLAFKEQFISQTVAAQVIGSSGSDQSRMVYIDKGERDGIKPDMAVMTAGGIVGKVLHAFPTTAQVLLLNDQTSGVGAVLEKSRLQGVLRGTPTGEVLLERIMADEQVQPGDVVLTSGGDQVFPKGLPVGTVAKVSPGSELFWRIRVRPAADLSRLEEVLVVTKVEEKQAEADAATGIRAVDILAQRLPTVPQKAPETDPSKDGNTAAAGTTMPEPNKPIVTSQPQRGSPGNAQPGVLVLDPKGAKAPAAKAQPGQGVPGKEQNKKPIAPLKPTPPPPAEPASQDAPQ
jgi:rod shape-determining protein MreC